MKSERRAVFISAGFRTGSTFLFGCLAASRRNLCFYEPLHPNLPALFTAGQTQASHRGVSDYFAGLREYRIAFETLGWRREFATHRLFLGADDDYPELEAYIRGMLSLDTGRNRILQFNRVSFRLAWLKRRFPGVGIIHLRRDPWRQWKSQRAHLAEEGRDSLFADGYHLVESLFILGLAAPGLLDGLGDGCAARAFCRCWLLEQFLADRHADQIVDYDQDLRPDSLDRFRAVLREAGIHDEELEEWMIGNLSRNDAPNACGSARFAAIMQEERSRFDGDALEVGLREVPDRLSLTREQREMLGRLFGAMCRQAYERTDLLMESSRNPNISGRRALGLLVARFRERLRL